MTSPSLAREVEEALGEPVAGSDPVAGGSINDARRLRLASGRTVFVKTRFDAPPAEFAAEAAGLEWLARAGARVPRVLGMGASLPSVEKQELADGKTTLGAGSPWLALEWVEAGTLSAAGAEGLGRALATLHRAGAPSHGSLPPGSPDSTLRLGSVELALAETAAWPELYVERMLRPIAARARDAGRLGAAEAGAVESVCERIEALAGPPEPPCRLHGDLWGGNVLAGTDGCARLIDPAAHGGHREVDLAMLRLFGNPGERVFAAYEEAYPLAAGHRERVGLWQLLPLLVHALLFGGSYGAAAGEAARRYL